MKSHPESLKALASFWTRVVSWVPVINCKFPLNSPDIELKQSPIAPITPILIFPTSTVVDGWQYGTGFPCLSRILIARNGNCASSELFATYLSAEIVNTFSDVTIQDCVLNSEFRDLTLKLYSENYIPSAKINLLREEIKHALQLENETVEIQFDAAAFGVEAVEDIVSEIRTKNVIFNGFFNEAQYNLDGNNLKITLKYGGYSQIQEGNFEQSFKLIVKKRFLLCFKLLSEVSHL